MNFEVVDAQCAKQLRSEFTERFIDTGCERFQKYRAQTDGYTGIFLWDCLRADLKGKFFDHTQEQAAESLKTRGSVYFMWDRWREGTVFADDFPNSVIKADGGDVGRLAVDEWNAELEAEKHDCYIEHPQLPSDIYIFDDSFSWFVIFTHETDECSGSENIVRYCIVYSQN